jgi:hypothetical protein
MWHPGEKEEVHTEFLWKDLKERDNLQTMSINKRIV